nr:MAG: RNA-dependent RNA polymerase [Plasmopara viticola lesion associated narnavirus 2]
MVIFNYTLCTNSRVQADLCRFRLWFDRKSPPSITPIGLHGYTSGRHYLSTKQAPCACSVKNPGSQSVTKNLDVLREEGFPLTQYTKEGLRQDLTLDFTQAGVTPSQVSYLGSMLSSIAAERDSMSAKQALSALDHSILEEEEEGDSLTPTADSVDGFKPVSVNRKARHKIEYEDPWKIHAGRVLAEARGNTLPSVIVWQGDGYRLQDALPPSLFGDRWTGSKRNRTRFSQIADCDIKMYVIMRHTHWGNALREMCADPDHVQHGWALNLKRRLRALLLGKPDPIWTSRQVKLIYREPEKLRNSKSRSQRLIEVLKTVDGMFFQRFLAYPEEEWTWSRYDTFVLGNLSHLISDEFLDGELCDGVEQHTTFYAQLKTARKTFKEFAHKRNLEGLSRQYDSIPEWLRQFIPIWEETSRTEGHRYDYLVGLLSQTRGCGTPPPLVILQAKIKFLKVVQDPPTPLSATQKGLVQAALDQTLSDLPDSAFTGLSTKSRITVATTACWEKTRQEGGTLEEISELVFPGAHGMKAPVRDLHTGKVVTRMTMSEGTIGEYVFWLSLDKVLRTPPDELRKAYLTVVREPGKGRSVTKASACLKIVLDLVSKISAVPLERGIPSSHSGMGKAHHGWNFFLELMSVQRKEELFSVAERDEREFADHIERLDVYADLFVSSTDYETATDYLNHDVARMLGDGWMRRCGIPPLLRSIVLATCYQPRTVFFKGTGPLAQFGELEPDAGESVRSVRLVRGVLMGDPLTKIVLHLVNIVTRTIGQNLLNNKYWLDQVFTNPQELYALVQRVSV